MNIFLVSDVREESGLLSVRVLKMYNTKRVKTKIKRKEIFFSKISTEYYTQPNENMPESI